MLGLPWIATNTNNEWKLIRILSELDRQPPFSKNFSVTHSKSLKHRQYERKRLEELKVKESRFDE